MLIRYFYRSPDEKVSWAKHFESQLYKTKQLNLPLELLGDFNYDLQHSDNHVKWLTLISSFDLKQIVNIPTRVTNTSATLLDHIYTSSELNVIDVSVPEVRISDHYPTLCSISTKYKFCSYSHREIHCGGWKNCDPDKLLCDIKKDIASSCFKSSVNQNIEKFTEVLTKNYNICVPLIKKRIKTVNQTPWIDKNVLHIMKQCDHMKLSGNIVKYQKFRNKCVNVICANKQKYCELLLLNAKGKCKKLWSHIHGLTKESKPQYPKHTVRIIPLPWIKIIEPIGLTHTMSLLQQEHKVRFLWTMFAKF